MRDLLDSGAHVSSAPTRRSSRSTRCAAIDAAVHRTLDEREAGTPSSGSPWPTRSWHTRPPPPTPLGDERRRGCLLPGYAADLVVLDTDIIAHPERIADAEVVATMLDGRWVHGAPPW